MYTYVKAKSIIYILKPFVLFCGSPHLFAALV